MKQLIDELKLLAQDKSVLIVEDDEMILDQLATMFEKFFAHIYKAQNTTQALKAYQNTQKPLLVVSDISLPDGSGLLFVKKIKEIDESQKVIIISALNEAQVFIESINQGVDRFVLKPIDLHDLLRATIDTLQKLEYDLALKKSKEDLKTSRDYALKLLQDQDIFLKNALHEINTPLGIIMTNIDLLRLSGTKSDSLEHIQAATRMIQISYDDIAYNMTQERFSEASEEIDLLEFIKQRIAYFGCIAEANELELVITTTRSKIITIAQTKLMRLVDNTLSNAIKYSKKPNKILISITKTTPYLVSLSVKNFGVIIKDTQKIFDRFHRETDQKGGYGLGLSIVKQICKEESITIEVSSNKSEGTEFRYIFRA
jgi:signal transduction histidine kinase